MKKLVLVLLITLTSLYGCSEAQQEHNSGFEEEVAIGETPDIEIDIKNMDASIINMYFKLKLNGIY